MAGVVDDGLVKSLLLKEVLDRLKSSFGLWLQLLSGSPRMKTLLLFQVHNQPQQRVMTSGEAIRNSKKIFHRRKVSIESRNGTML